MNTKQHGYLLPDNALFIWQLAVLLNVIAVIISLRFIIKRVSMNANWVEAVLSFVFILIPFAGPALYLLGRKKWLKPVA